MILILKTIVQIVRRRRGSQLVEEGLLLGISLIALMIVVSMVSGLLTTIQTAVASTQDSFDKFLTQVFRDDFNKIWEFIFGQKVQG
ncbi:MAG: hypothetical protein DRJ32_01160 [Thermoprotei archaeon]|nr:MAG: hypothetical protein DRJ32_01160 [Thermoprotei archaeon]HDD63967.1 hypothetical protein [Thermoprotei archaeon]